MLVDSHCHLDRIDLTPYEGDLGGALDAARARQIEHFLCVAVNLEHVPELLAISEQHADVFASVGVHPLESQGPESTVERMVELAAHPRVVAIGETGLDYHYSPDSQARQQARFVTHLEAAREARKPVIVHTRDAREDTLDILRRHSDPELGGVLHCFTEDLAMAQAALELNFYISISGIVTFRTAQQIREVAEAIPLERLLVETDAPYLAPVPHRGKKNEPQYVREVAEFIAELRGISLQELAEQTTANFFRLFRDAKPVSGAF